MKVKTLQLYMALCQKYGQAPSFEGLKRFDHLTHPRLKGGVGHDFYRRAV